MSTASVFFSLLFLTISTICTSEVYNMWMGLCKQTLMPHVTDLDLSRFSGRWYMSQISTHGPTQLPNNLTSTAVDIFRTVLPVDNEGRMNVDFLVVSRTMATDSACTFNDTYVCQMVKPGTCSFSYGVKYLNMTTALQPDGYYVQWSNYQILATDYNTTAVLLFEPVLNGFSHMMFSEFQILVRNKGAQPNTTLVQETMAGFCVGQFSNPASVLYIQVPNNSTLACMAPQQRN